MLKFIDISNGNVFSGVKPYTHWFAEGQSVNINYYKEIVFISNEATIDIEIEENPCFKLMTFSNHHTIEHLNGFDYYNINDFLVDSLTLEGISYNNVYLYRLFVYAFSSNTGEYKVDVTVGDVTIEVGADFYPENELLTNDLENLGVEIPMQIQKAIYESNIHEEAMDNILMNRKWKELLLEYWSIVACKGSYRSLVNSMKFFEYGELLKIMEFWKEHYNKDIYISNDLEQILDDRFREQLSVMSKSTYIGLYLAMDRYTKNPDGTVPMESGSGDDAYWVQDNPKLYSIFDANPELGQISSMWNAIDLSLKMTLVGNFFSTYFMPLHLDLLHSTIENVVFTNTIKMLSSVGESIRDHVDLCGNFLTSVKMDSNYYIKPQDVYVTPRTILGYKDFWFNESGSGSGDFEMMRDNNFTRYSTGVKFLGVDTELDTSYLSTTPGQIAPTPNIWELVFSGANVISTFGAIVPIDVKITSNVRGTGVVNNNLNSVKSVLKSAQINWVKDGKELFSYTDNGIWIEPIEYQDKDGNTRHKFEFLFNLMFTDPGTYHFFITFTSTDSFEYAHEFRVNILDDSDCLIHLYKVERVDPTIYKDYEITANVTGGSPSSITITDDSGSGMEYELNEFMFSQTYPNPIPWSGKQYICADINNMQKSTGLNHVIIYTLNGNGDNALIDGQAPGNASTMANRPGKCQDYWWFDRNIGVELKDDGTIGPNTTVVTGIRKYFTIDSEIVTLYEKTFKKGNKKANVKIEQLRSIIYVTVNEMGGSLSMDQCSLSDYVTFKVFGHEETVRVYPDYNYFLLETDSDGDVKGLASKKLKCEGDFYQLVDEDRFIPFFHKLVKVTEDNCEVLPSELMVAIPELRRTYTDETPIVWEFKNSSTMESITTYDTYRCEFGEDYTSTYKSKEYIDFYEPMIGKFEPRVLSPGYYNINLNYKYAGVQHKESRDAAFKIRKGYEG